MVKLIEIAAGPAGGKTSLAQQLSQFGFSFCQEELSPYLESPLYETELGIHLIRNDFISLKAKQIAQAISFEQGVPIVFDYCWYLESGYCHYYMQEAPQSLKVTLQALEYKFASLPKPDCVIKIKASPEKQREHVKKRGRQFEQHQLTLKNLKAMSAMLEQSFVDHCPKDVNVIEVDANKFDVSNLKYINDLVIEIKEILVL